MVTDYVHKPNQDVPLYVEHIFPFNDLEVLIAEDLGIASGHGRPKNEYERMMPPTERVLHIMGYITKKFYRQDQQGNQVSKIEEVPALVWQPLSEAIKASDLEGRIQFTQ